MPYSNEQVGEQKVHDLIAHAFVAEGVDAVFGMMGDGNMAWLNALSRAGVRIYDVRHEGAGLAMADGWARVRYSPGVCTTTAGPGFTQLATQMVVASRARTPLVAFCGDVVEDDFDDVQRFDEARFAAATEAGFVRVVSAESAYDSVQRAFYLARTEQRPVVLSAPRNVQEELADTPGDYKPSIALLSPDPAYPHPDSIRRAVATVTAARRPVILVGRGARRSDAGDIVLRLAERTGAIIATTLMAKNWLAEDDFHVGIAGLYGNRTSIELFQKADCVIAVGASLNRYTTEHGYLFPNAKYVQVDTAPGVVMGEGRIADCYVNADARLGLTLLHDALAEQGYSEAGFRTPDTRNQIVHSIDSAAAFERFDDVIDPREACRILDETIPRDFGLVLGTGHQTGFSSLLVNQPHPYVLAQHQFGSIGQGMTTAIGAIAASGIPGIAIDGDASMLMHIQEFETAVRYRLPLLAVVMNDEALGAEYHMSRAKGLDADLSLIWSPDMGAVARAFGGRGSQVRNGDELRAAVSEFARDPFPTMLDVRVARDVMSVSYRRRWLGEDA